MLTSMRYQLTFFFYFPLTLNLSQINLGNIQCQCTLNEALVMDCQKREKKITLKKPVHSTNIPWRHMGILVFLLKWCLFYMFMFICLTYYEFLVHFFTTHLKKWIKKIFLLFFCREEDKLKEKRYHTQRIKVRGIF